MDEEEKNIREMLSDDDNIVEEIKECPHTYYTLLKNHYDNGTYQQILRRRLKRLVKEDEIWKMRVPGTRFGLVLFSLPNHKYKILISQGLVNVRIFYMYEYSEDDNDVILKKYWELKGTKWNRWMYSDDILKIPKFSLRDGGFRLWD